MRTNPSLLHAAIGFSVLIFGMHAEPYAQLLSYPSKPIRVIVPFAPGGSNDIMARLIGQKLTALWAQPVIIENRGGAGGTIGIEAGVRSPPDGYTLIMAASIIVIAPSLYEKLSWDPLRDLTAVANLVEVPAALAINPRVPANSVKELVVIAKSKRGLLSYGSSGIGATSQLSAELFKSAIGAAIVHVSYKGTAPAMTDLIAGQIDLMFADLAVVTPLEKAGKLRLLAVAGTKRVSAAPALPTIPEAGVKTYDAFDTWIGITAPAGVSNEIVAKLNAAIINALKTSDVRQRMDTLGYEAIGDTPEHFTATIKADAAKFKKIIKGAGIKAEL